MHNYNVKINDASQLFCDFEDTGVLHNGRKVYKCKYCNMQLAMDNPSTKVMCFAKKRELDAMVNPNTMQPIDGITDKNKIIEIATQQILDKGNLTEQTFDTQNMMLEHQKRMADHENNMCSKEQIDTRMAVCQKCEYFKENSCLLCGCNVVRERNYNNKLAKKNQHCPIFKWKAIQD